MSSNKLYLFSTIWLFLLANMVAGQSFQLSYSQAGLGSNATWHMAEERKDCASGLKIEINETLLMYSICEKTDQFRISKTFNDTIWVKRRNFYKTVFRQSSIDSIISILDSLQGKYVYATNPDIMSGSIFQPIARV